MPGKVSVCCRAVPDIREEHVPGHPPRNRLVHGLARVAAAAQRHPVLTGAVFFACCSLAFVAQGLLPGRNLSASDYLWSAAPWRSLTPAGVRDGGANGELADSVAAFQLFTQYAAHYAGGWPLWNPHIMSGRPFLANAQSALLSPFTVPAYLLPFWASLGVTAVLKLFTASFGGFLLARTLGLRLGGSLMTGLTYGFGLFFVVWLSWPLSSVWAWIPLLLVCTELLVRRPGVLPFAGLSVVIALQYSGGHPESSFHALFAASVFAVVRIVFHARSGGLDRLGVVRALASFAGAQVAGAALVAMLIIPFAELLHQSADLANRRVAPPGTNPKYLLGALLTDYWGRPTQFTTEPFIAPRAFYAGALPLLLAAFALLRGRDLGRWLTAAFGALALAIVVGVPGIYGLVISLPGFHEVINTRLTILFLLCVALLAGWGLDDLAAGRLRASATRRRLLFAGAAVAIVVPAVWMVATGVFAWRDVEPALSVAWGFTDQPSAGRNLAVIPASSLIVWVTVASLALALVVVASRHRTHAAVLVAVALALTGLDLARAGVGQNPAIPAAHAQQPTTPAIRLLQRARPARFAALQPRTAISPLPANTAMRYGLYDARGYDYPIEARYESFWKRNVVREPFTFTPRTTLARGDGQSLHALRLLGVTDIVQDGADPALRRSDLRLRYRDADTRIYALAGALPRAYVAYGEQPVADEARALDAVSARAFAGQAVITEPGGRAGLPAGPAPAISPARIVRYGSDRVVIDAQARTLGMLVLTDTWYPGWKATVDGRPTPIRRVNYLLRGVSLRPGVHRVEFRYQPSSWRIGWIISLVTALGLIVAVAVAMVRRHGRAATT